MRTAFPRALPLPDGEAAIHLPPHAPETEQDEEWFELVTDGERERFRVHDYAALYGRRGLYETLVYDALGCRSPQRVVRALDEALGDCGSSPSSLRAIDLGAGNGVVGDHLRSIGVSEVLGIDILPEAARAARRDRPQTYDDYLVCDLSVPGPDVERRLRAFAPNCLVTVAALGFGDIPPRAFLHAYELIPQGGWLAMCIKDRFLEPDEDSGFGRMLRSLVDGGDLEVQKRERYVHRMNLAGEELEYVALVARKARKDRVDRDGV